MGNEPDNGFKYIAKDLKNCGQTKQCLENFTLNHTIHYSFFFFFSFFNSILSRNDQSSFLLKEKSHCITLATFSGSSHWSLFLCLPMNNIHENKQAELMRSIYQRFKFFRGSTATARSKKVGDVVPELKYTS